MRKKFILTLNCMIFTISPKKYIWGKKFNKHHWKNNKKNFSVKFHMEIKKPNKL